MKIAIIGDRTITDPKILEDAIKASGFTITEVVSGGAKGADTLAENWAKKNKIPIKVFKPNWDDLTAEGAIVKERVNPFNKKMEKYNANAGFARNSDIINYADGVIALQTNGDTNGTQDSVKKAKTRNIPVYIHEDESGFEYNF